MAASPKETIASAETALTWGNASEAIAALARQAHPQDTLGGSMETLTVSNSVSSSERVSFILERHNP